MNLHPPRLSCSRLDHAVVFRVAQLPRTHADERMAGTCGRRWRALIEDHRVGVQRVRAKGEVEVPRQHGPLARAESVAVDEVVFVGGINVLADDGARVPVHPRRQVHVVEEPCLQRGAGEPEIRHHALQIGEPLRVTVLFFKGRRRREVARARVADSFVKCAVLVDAVPVSFAPIAIGAGNGEIMVPVKGCVATSAPLR